MAQRDPTASFTLVAILSACLVTAAGEERPTPPELLHIECSASVELEASPAAVFALLEPAGREKWVKRWRMVYLHPTSAAGRAGAVVRQRHRSGAVEQFWLLSEHEPPERIKYVIFVPGMEIWEFDTRLQERPGGGTVATFEHRITSLAPEVNPEVQAFSDGFEAYVGRLKTALSAELHPTP